MQQADYSGFARIGDAYLQGRDIRYQREQDQLERFRQDNRIERQERERKLRDRDNMLEKLGSDAVVDPNTGELDVSQSVLKRQQRLESDRIAESAGELEGLGMSQDIPEELRSRPAYRVGKSRALAKKTEKDLAHNYEKEIEDLRYKRQIDAEGIRQRGLTDRANARVPVDRSDDITEVEEDLMTGKKVTRKFGSEDDYQKYKVSLGDKAKPATKTNVDKAIEDFEQAMKEGKKGRLVENGDGNVTFEQSSIRPDNPEIVRRRLEQLKKREGGKQAPRVINFKDLNIR